jgi:hypothetical protein
MNLKESVRKNWIFIFIFFIHKELDFIISNDGVPISYNIVVKLTSISSFIIKKVDLSNKTWR